MTTDENLWKPVAQKAEPSPNLSPSFKTVMDGLKRAEKLFAAKNEEYASGDDILGNFRRLAAQQNLPMSTAWFFLASKHIDVITQYVKDKREDVKRERTQPISERIDDLIVYSLLLLAIVEEEER